MDYPIHGMYDAKVIYGNPVKHSKNNERTAAFLCYNDKKCGKYRIVQWESICSRIVS